jgi:hypothetical protein
MDVSGPSSRHALHIPTRPPWADVLRPRSRIPVHRCRRHGSPGDSSDPPSRNLAPLDIASKNRQPFATMRLHPRSVQRVALPGEEHRGPARVFSFGAITRLCHKLAEPPTIGDGKWIDRKGIDPRAAGWTIPILWKERLVGTGGHPPAWQMNHSGRAYSVT